MDKKQRTNLYESVRNELHLLLSSLKKKVKADITSLYVYDSERGNFLLPLGIGLHDPDLFNDPMMIPHRNRGAARLTLDESPFCIDRIEEHPELYGSFAKREHIQSFAGASCRIGGQIVGILFISFRIQHSFSDQEVKILQDFAFRIGNTIMESLILQNLPVEITGSASSQEIYLQNIVKLACTSTKASIGIWLLDRKEKGRLILGASNGFSEIYQNKAYHTLDDNSILCQVFSSGNKQIIEDLKSEEYFPYKKIAQDAGWRSIFYCPIISRGKRIGVIESFMFSPWCNNQSLITTYHQLADLVGVALENIRCLEEAEELTRLTQKINIEPDVESILQSIVNTAHELTDADSSSIFLYDRRTKRFTYGVRSFCMEDIEIEMYREIGLTEHIIDTGKVVHISNSRNDNRTNKLSDTERVKSLIGVRLDLGQEGVGVLYVRGNQIEHFVEADEKLLKTISHQTSLEFHGRFLLRPIKDIEDAAAKRFEKEKVLENICDDVMGLGFDYAAIQLINEEDRIIETVYVKGVETDWAGVAKHSLDCEPKIRDIQVDVALADPPLIKIITGWCEKFDDWIYDEFNHNKYARVWVPIVLVRNKNGIVIDHWIDTWSGEVVLDKEVKDPSDGRLGYKICTEMPLPIECTAAGDKFKIIGTIEAGYIDPNADELSLRKRIKYEQGIVLAKKAAQLALELRQTMLPYVLENIADSAWEIIRADSASLHFSYNQKREEFSYEVCMGELSQEFLEGHQPRPSGLGQTAISEGKVKFVPDISQGHADDALETINPNVWKVGVRAMAAVPLLMKEKTGVLYVLFRKPHHFTDIEIGWIQLFANRAVDAIRNSISYAQIRDNELALTALHSISNSLASEPQDKHLLRKIAGNAMNILAADTTTIIEYEETEKRFLMPPDIVGRLLYEREKERIRELGQYTPPRLLLKYLDDSDDSDDFYTTDDSQNDPILSRPNRVIAKTGFFTKREKIISSAGIALRVAKGNQYGKSTEGVKETVGVMFVNFRRHHVFTNKENKIIKTLAANAAIAIKNRRSLAALTAGTPEISTTLELNKLLGLIVNRAVNITGGNVANIRLVEGLKSDELVAYAQYPENEAIDEGFRRIKVGEGPPYVSIPVA